MIDKVQFFSNLVFCVISGVMALSFLSFPIPQKEALKNYRISLRVLSGAFFIFSILLLTVLLFNFNDNRNEPLTYLSIIISSTQALLFSFTLITLFNPNFVNKKYLLIHLSPLIFFSLLYGISTIIFHDPVLKDISDVPIYIGHPTIIIRIFFALYYCFQLVFYTRLYVNEENKYRDELLNYFSEPFKLQLKWVRYAFMSALAIGTLSLVVNFTAKPLYDTVFTILCSIFYLVFGIEYIKYTNIYSIIEPAIQPNIQLIPSTIGIQTNVKKWELFKNRIISEKYYLKEGVNIEDMAEWLKIGRTTLSNYINNEEGVNFNFWINSLRIEEAKRVMLANPDWSIMNISHLTGYSEQANFSRQFKLITGESPLLWKKKNLSQQAVA
jgi:AraC-like DNA-binding protein